MQWDRSNAIGLALAPCRCCHGMGIVRKSTVHTWADVPCKCVFRSIFRACLNRFRECQAAGGRMSTVSLESCGGPGGRRVYSRKREEFCADFELTARRALGNLQYRVFRSQFVLGVGWRASAWRVKLDRGTFFHEVYCIEEKLGRVYAELRPYALYPLSEYFGGGVAPPKPAPLVVHTRAPRPHWLLAEVHARRAAA